MHLELAYTDVPEAGWKVLYVKLPDGRKSVRTIEIDSGTLVDVDEHGSPTGFEIINPERPWPLNEILERFALTAEVAENLRLLMTADNAKSESFSMFRSTGDLAVA